MKPFQVFLILTAILIFSQPPVFGGRHARISVPTIPESAAGPTFHEDLLLRWGSDPLFLLVITDDTPGETRERIIRAVDASGTAGAALLVTAPRHDRGDAGRVAALLREVPSTVPRIFLASGSRTEWTVSVPGDVTPLWLVRLIASIPEARLNEAQLNAARLGYGRRNPALEEALAGGVAAAQLVLTEPEALIPVLRSLESALVEARDQPREQERNYLILPHGVIISEFRIVQGLVLLAIILLLYTVILPRRVRHYLRSMVRNIPAILITLLVIVVSLMAANLALRLVGRIPRISPDPLLLAGGKIAFGSLVLSVLAAFLGHRIRRATAVYSGAAVLFLLAGAILSGAVSITLGAYFSVSFVFGVLFSIGRNVWIKGAALLLSLVPVVYLVLALAPAADQHMAAALLTPPLAREVVTAVMLLPILLMFFRLDSIASNTPLLPIFAMIATIGLALTTASLIVQARNPEPYEVFIRDHFPPGGAILENRVPESGEREVITEAGPVTRDIPIHIPGEGLLLCPGTPCRRELSATLPPFSLELERSLLLDRHTISWRINYREQAEAIRLVLESDHPVQLYATDTPTEQPTGSRGTLFEFRAGPYPPEELSGSVVLRSTVPFSRVTIRATSRFPGFAATPERDINVTHLGRIWTIRDTAILD
ncbi:MAG: hypothetical protein EA427_01680 [Spirochaetaceae bacterium]|nr:MAG: hypothetical protein EA427_01680 [Spirochaetaceae bacterium]